MRTVDEIQDNKEFLIPESDLRPELKQNILDETLYL